VPHHVHLAGGEADGGLTTIGARLAELENSRQTALDLDLLDQLPIVPILMEHPGTRAVPPGLRRVRIEVRYRHDLNQVTIHAELTTSTPTPWPP
jgi:hypothetical protein